MAAPTLEALVASAADGPRLVGRARVAAGGVDPLGLRQINFNLMDQVFPGVNNVARHIRPFVVVTWAWRRAARLAQDDGRTVVDPDLLRDFVDRIEVVYAWSQFLVRPDSDLPGRDYLGAVVAADHYDFGGKSWASQRDARRYSTALSAPINYGPALRNLGWLEAVQGGGFRPTAVAMPAVDALEQRLAQRGLLELDVLGKLGAVRADQADVRRLADIWKLTAPGKVERQVMAALLVGPSADPRLAAGVALAVEAARSSSTADAETVRRRMCGKPSRFRPPAGLAAASTAWRRMQVRQLFRQALEALLGWVIDQLEGGPMTTGALVETFFAEQGVDGAATTAGWLAAAGASPDPVRMLQALDAAIDLPSWAGVPSAVHAALALCLREAPDVAEDVESADRLPLALAARQVRGWLEAPASTFLAHVLEAWVLGQHTLWSVGRGLADARAGVRTLLRLRVVLEEGGWALTPEVAQLVPRATPDRLRTILSLAGEAGLLDLER